MELNNGPAAIRFNDLKPGSCIVNPTERELCGVTFQPGRMMEIEGQSSHLDEDGEPLINVVMGRAGDRVKGTDIVIDASHLPRWQRALLPVACQKKRLRAKLLEGAMPIFEERYGRL